MAIVHVQDATASTSTSSPVTLTLGATPTLGNWLIIIYGAYASSGTPTPGPQTGASGGGVASWASSTAPDSTNHTFSGVYFGQITGTPVTTVKITLGTISHNTMQVSEFSGIFGKDQTSATISGSTPGSITPHSYGSLFVAAACDNGDNITAGPGGSWTNLGSTGGAGLGAWIINSTGALTAQNPSFTQTIQGGVAMACFSSRGSMFEAIGRV